MTLWDVINQSLATFSASIFLEYNESEKLSYNDINIIVDLFETEVRTSNCNLNRHIVAIHSQSKLKALLSQISLAYSNCIYLHIDASAPTERNINLLKDNEIKYLLTEKEFLSAIRESNLKNKNYQEYELKSIGLVLIQLSESASDTIIEESLSNIIFTSGSTGKPKGIKISHQNILCFVNWCCDNFKFKKSDKFCSIAPLHFDLSVFDIYVPMMLGSTIYLFDNEEIKNPRLITQRIDSHNINVTYTTPTLYNLLFTYGKIKKRSLQTIHTKIFAGEVMPLNLLSQMKTKVPQSRYFNFYGPTETNVCTWYDATNIEDTVDNKLPIGHPCPYATIKIKDGELLISGDSVFLGYYNDEKKTAKLLETIGAKKWYHTGDKVSENNNRELLFSGRIDRMIKLRGFRIELDEIEYVISEHTSIVSNAVIDIKDQSEEHKIIAFINTEEKSDIVVSKLQEFCSNQLPHYMVPSKFIVIDQLPITTNGKVDYKKLKTWTY